MTEQRRSFAGLQSVRRPMPVARDANYGTAPFDVPPPGAVAWLDVANDEPGRRRTGPLGMQIVPLDPDRLPYFFKGGRLRGTRCVWSASTVNGAEMHRAARQPMPPPFDNSVHLLARADGDGSVFDPVGASAGTLRVLDPGDEITEQFEGNTHLFTLNVPIPALGIDQASVHAMRGRTYEVTQFQSQLLRAAAGLLLVGGSELSTPSSLVGVDRYLAALAALLMRTAVDPPSVDAGQTDRLQLRADMIILEQSADPQLSPASIAAQLDVSLRQLYRAFTGTESPAARIRRRRLERAAELLGSRGQIQVERVASECGFASAEYFSRAFRKEYGLSPRAYRSAHRDDSVAH